jgi:hypothetical protein
MLVWINLNAFIKNIVEISKEVHKDLVWNHKTLTSWLDSLLEESFRWIAWVVEVEIENIEAFEGWFKMGLAWSDDANGVEGEEVFRDWEWIWLESQNAVFWSETYRLPEEFVPATAQSLTLHIQFDSWFLSLLTLHHQKRHWGCLREIQLFKWLWLTSDNNLETLFNEKTNERWDILSNSLNFSSFSNLYFSKDNCRGVWK